jgi:hypothetical protein
MGVNKRFRLTAAERVAVTVSGELPGDLEDEVENAQ